MVVILFILHSLDAIILITVVNEQPNTDSCLNSIIPTLPHAMQSSRIQESLWSALLYYQIQVIGISRYGNPCA